jgi:hypothetical protein
MCPARDVEEGGSVTTRQGASAQREVRASHGAWRGIHGMSCVSVCIATAVPSGYNAADFATFPNVAQTGGFGVKVAKKKKGWPHNQKEVLQEL